MTTSDYLTVLGILLTLGITIFNTVKIRELEKYKIISSRSDKTLTILRDVIKEINEVENQEEPKLTSGSMTMLMIVDNFNTRARRIIRITSTALPFLSAKHQILMQSFIDSYNEQTPKELSRFFKAKDEENIKETIQKQVKIFTALRKDLILLLQQEMQEILEHQKQ